MWPNPQFPADFVTFTEEILNGKLHFLRDVISAKIYVHSKNTRLILLGITLKNGRTYFKNLAVWTSELCMRGLTFYRPMFPSYRNQSIDVHVLDFCYANSFSAYFCSKRGSEKWGFLLVSFEC